MLYLIRCRLSAPSTPSPHPPATHQQALAYLLELEDIAREQEAEDAGEHGWPPEG